MDPDPVAWILGLVAGGAGAGSSDRTAIVDPATKMPADPARMGMTLAAAAALCNAAAFVVARRTNASALTLTW